MHIPTPFDILWVLLCVVAGFVICCFIGALFPISVLLCFTAEVLEAPNKPPGKKYTETWDLLTNPQGWLVYSSFVGFYTGLFLILYFYI